MLKMVKIQLTNQLSSVTYLRKCWITFSNFESAFSLNICRNLKLSTCIKFAIDGNILL